ncbi:MAG: outer membrane lipoprotein chaperone LolA [Lautropia sp.]
MEIVPARRRLGGLCALALSALIGWSPSGARAADAIAQLKAFSKSTQSARGTFSQQLLKGGGGSTRATGEFAFSRPGRFRWDIQTPYQQLIVTDGRKLYFYDKDLRQVTVKPAGDVIRATPAAVLFGDADLEAAFALKALGTRDELEWVEALPKQADSGFDRIIVGLRDGLPVMMEVRDAFAQINRFEFTRITRNAAVSDADFAFTPPAGVDVIE